MQKWQTKCEPMTKHNNTSLGYIFVEMYLWNYDPWRYRNVYIIIIILIFFIFLNFYFF